jgi:lysine/ornithine N-monooxygenase
MPWKTSRKTGKKYLKTTDTKKRIAYIRSTYKPERLKKSLEYGDTVLNYSGIDESTLRELWDDLKYELSRVDMIHAKIIDGVKTVTMYAQTKIGKDVTITLGGVDWGRDTMGTRLLSEILLQSGFHPLSSDASKKIQNYWSMQHPMYGMRLELELPIT